MIKLFACLLIWFGCLLPYLASPKQVLTSYHPAKPAAWLGFCLLVSLAFYSLCSVYSDIIAALISLIIVMCSWVIITLLAGHFAGRFARVCIISAGLFSFITLAGSHV